MTHVKNHYLVLLGAMIGIAGPAYAQQAADTAKAAAATPGTASAPAAAAPAASATAAATGTPAAAPAAKSVGGVTAPAVPSADTLRRAKVAGYYTKTSRGVVMYCKDTAQTGTRFVTTGCVDEAQLLVNLAWAQQNKDDLKHMLGAPARSN